MSVRYGSVDQYSIEYYMLFIILARLKRLYYSVRCVTKTFRRQWELAERLS